MSPELSIAEEQPCPGTSHWRDLHDRVMMPNYAPLSMVPARGQGAWLWDDAGNRYLDFAGGIAVSALGHANPELVEALANQARKLWHVSNILTNQPALELARKLIDATFADKVFFANSGSEANEAALKLARRVAQDRHAEDKYEILAFENAFHGRTFFTVSVGGQAKYSQGFGPNPPGISHLPYNHSQAVLEWFEKHGDRACAVILEPCQGEGGVTPATREFVDTIRDCCERYNALLILDEVQTGMGRSGALYLHEKLGVVPDILTTAKALGCGFPISATLTTDEVAEHLAVGTHGSTFGGNPMACAVAGKVIDIINTPEILNNVDQRSEQLVAGLDDISRRYHLFTEIRGIGLLLGCVLVEQYAEKARDLMTLCNECGLLTLVAGPGVLRLAPPLNISESEIAEGLARMEEAVARFVQSAEPSS
ncbi:MAG: acetylornithine/succinylornithine family transaminase [Gammaproteobacteria bacterium]|nr:acetylornithine/succinylornithine family transaminase [Gammaproteobacteria bacterium]